MFGLIFSVSVPSESHLVVKLCLCLQCWSRLWLSVLQFSVENSAKNYSQHQGKGIRKKRALMVPSMVPSPTSSTFCSCWVICSCASRHPMVKLTRLTVSRSSSDEDDEDENDPLLELSLDIVHAAAIFGQKIGPWGG